jgi:ribosome biogenesis GTPase
MPRKNRPSSGRQGRKIRVSFRRNRTAPPRAKQWTPDEDDDKTEGPLDESVVAKGDLSRKRTIIEPDDPATDNLPRGIVVAMRGLIAEVDDGSQIWPCTVRRVMRTRSIDERQPVTVGDVVSFRIASEQEGVSREGVIERVSPRRGYLSRMAGRRRQTIVANVDVAIIVSSAGLPPFKPHLIDRYLVAAHAGGIEPVVCLNKIDLDHDRAARKILRIYRRLGYVTVETSAHTGEGIDELRALLTGRCSAVAGQSGVGKSSLLNAVDSAISLRTGEVNTDTRKGRHVTTTAVLLRLTGGGYVVDTPGVKSFDLSVVPLNEIEMHLREFLPYVPHCRFADCTHLHESDCAVKQALEEGAIHPLRYESYVRMFEDQRRQT